MNVANGDESSREMDRSQKGRRSATACWGWGDVANSSVDALPDWAHQVTFVDDHENIMKWDDSGALEAFQQARAREQAREAGVFCQFPLPNPDLYNGVIDWDAKLAAAAASKFASIPDKKPPSPRTPTGAHRFNSKRQWKPIERSRQEVYCQPTGWGDPTPQQQQLPYSQRPQQQPYPSLSNQRSTRHQQQPQEYNFHPTGWGDATPQQQQQQQQLRYSLQSPTNQRSARQYHHQQQEDCWQYNSHPHRWNADHSSSRVQQQYGHQLPHLVN